MLNILVVAEQAIVRRVLRVALSKFGYTVSLAVSESEALTMIRSQLPDAVVTDGDAPSTRGPSLCAAIESQCSGRPFPIFIVTSLSGLQYREWAANYRNIYFLEKPLSVRQLTARLTDSSGTETVIMKVGG